MQRKSFPRQHGVSLRDAVPLRDLGSPGRWRWRRLENPAPGTADLPGHVQSPPGSGRLWRVAASPLGDRITVE